MLHHGSSQIELCSLLNGTIRADTPALMDPAAVAAKGINELCLTRRAPEDAVKFPAGGRCFRGGGFDMAHKDFFTVGKKYRCAYCTTPPYTRLLESPILHRPIQAQ